MLLISGSEVGQRVEQHRTVIEAARAEGVELLAYTSIANADTTGMKLAGEHKATEALLRESGVPFVLLRNGWYLENYTEQLPGTLAQGAVAGSAGDGKVSGAAAGGLRPCRRSGPGGRGPGRQGLRAGRRRSLQHG